MNRLPIHYTLAHAGELLRNDLYLFDKMVDSDYEWVTGEVPKPYRRILMTVIDYTKGTRDKCLNELVALKEKGVVEHVMFDSGGFQSLRRPGFSLDRLMAENVHIYKEHDWADAYILPDQPPNPKDEVEKQREHIFNTINTTLETFNLLPSEIQKKCMPVFHVQSTEDIDDQFEEYRHIINLSKMVCYAIPGARKTLDIKNAKLMRYLRQVLYDDVKIHALGVSSPAAVWLMYTLGIHSYDSISPRIAGSNGSIIFPSGSYDATIKRKDPITLGKLHDLRKYDSHKCPFCDNYNQLLRNFRYRILHNLIVYDELNWHLRDLDFYTFSQKYPAMYRVAEAVFNQEKVVREQLRLDFDEMISKGE